MLELHLQNFDIEQIADSGQCFRMYPLENNTWEIFALNETLKIQKKILDNKKIHIFDCSKEKFDNFWFNYFDLQTDYKIFQKRILKTNDKYLQSALKFGEGLRILKQDIWEMIVSFVISQRNNIPRIKNCLKKLCELNQNKFPTCEDILNLQGEKLKFVKLGYREDYLLNISETIFLKKFSLEELQKKSYAESVKYLCSLKGVGEKVANCISLFSLHKLEAFPIDVWIQKIIKKYYNENFSLESLNLKDIGGVVQQYMFFFERNIK